MVHAWVLGTSISHTKWILPTIRNRQKIQNWVI